MPGTMSEKVKGKQRAVEAEGLLLPEESEGELSQSESMLQFHKGTVRFTDSAIPDLDLSVRQTDIVQFLKTRIRDDRPLLKSKRLRLIVNGRLLTDSDVLYPLLSADPSIPNWIHCSVGQALSLGESDSDLGKSQRAQIRPVRGLDRLASIGFSEEDIADFRRQFHSQSSADFIDSADFATDEEFHEHARALEEQWIDSAIESNTPLPTLASGSTLSSSESSTLRGLLVGFFFPFLPLFFLKEPSPPPIFWENGAEVENHAILFNQGVSMAIAFGFMMNVLFGLWRFLLDGT